MALPLMSALHVLTQVEEPIEQHVSQGAPGSEPTRSVHATEPSGILSCDANDSSKSSSEDVKVAHDGTLEFGCLCPKRYK